MLNVPDDPHAAERSPHGLDEPYRAKTPPEPKRGLDVPIRGGNAKRTAVLQPRFLLDWFIHGYRLSARRVSCPKLRGLFYTTYALFGLTPSL